MQYPGSTLPLQFSLTKRETELVNARQKVLDTAFDFSYPLSGEGRRQGSATVCGKSAKLRADDPTVFNNCSVSLAAAAVYARQEPLYRRALAIREQASEPGHPDTAESLNDLAESLRAKGDYAAAE